MRPSSLFSVIEALYPTRQPFFVWGPPGVGKSDIVRAVAKALKIGFIDLRALLLDPVDLRGLPYRENNRARFAVPEFLPTTGEGIILIDELPAAPTMVQAAFLQLILDRALGEYRLPDGWIVGSAGNRQEDRAGANRIITPMLNRFVHIDVEVHAEDWDRWALDTGIRPEVRAFIKSRPNMLHKFEPRLNERAFPTPRSWAFVSRILGITTADTLFSLVAGCVGDGPAAEFISFMKAWRNMPDIDAILADPAGYEVPVEADVLYAVSAALVERCRDVKAGKGRAAVVYATRMMPEFAVLTFRDLVKIDRTVLTTNEGQAFLRKNQDALIAA